MPLFVCEKCSAIENTALGKFWAEDEKLCSECGFGKWHGKFPKEDFDPDKWEYFSDDYFIQKIKLI